MRAARLAVVGVGGVGSWAAEALARSGVAAIALVDLDHVAESNINRQVQALGRTVGQAKVIALRDRLADIHPACEIDAIDAFADASTWPACLPAAPVHAVIDACDDGRAKAMIAAWSLDTHVPLIAVGAAGGKRRPERVDLADLADVTHDPVLASLRQRLRKFHGAPRSGPLGVECVFSQEAVVRPQTPQACGTDDARADVRPAVDGGLNCSGYGSSVTVTATFGLVAASRAIDIVIGERSGITTPRTRRHGDRTS